MRGSRQASRRCGSRCHDGRKGGPASSPVLAGQDRRMVSAAGRAILGHAQRGSLAVGQRSRCRAAAKVNGWLAVDQDTAPMPQEDVPWARCHDDPGHSRSITDRWTQKEGPTYGKRHSGVWLVGDRLTSQMPAPAKRAWVDPAFHLVPLVSVLPLGALECQHRSYLIAVPVLASRARHVSSRASACYQTTASAICHCILAGIDLRKFGGHSSMTSSPQTTH